MDRAHLEQRHVRHKTQWTSERRVEHERLGPRDLEGAIRTFVSANDSDAAGRPRGGELTSLRARMRLVFATSPRMDVSSATSSVAPVDIGDDTDEEDTDGGGAGAEDTMAAGRKARSVVKGTS